MKAKPLILWSLLGLAILAAIAAFASIRSMRPQLELGVGYAARVGCGCHYLGGRALSDCTKDFEPGMDQISLSKDDATKTVTASVPLIASRSVRYDSVLGCQPRPYSGKTLNIYR